MLAPRLMASSDVMAITKWSVQPRKAPPPGWVRRGGAEGYYSDIPRGRIMRGEFLPPQSNSDRGDWFRYQKGKPRRSGARTHPGKEIKMKISPLTTKSRLF
jgi:hypothetical protein